jgi:choline dehydrogenase-like flavoprotein
MANVVVVGSGATGVHFALSALQRGHDVTMLDVGHTRTRSAQRAEAFNELKRESEDPVRYFLGEQFESVVYPGSETDYYTKYYGVPPSKSYVFRKPDAFGWEGNGFEPLISFAQGGLAEAWTGGVYPLNDDELQPFPFGFREMSAYYDEAARRIGVNGRDDDLARFFPVHANLIPPLRLDPHSEQLLGQYEKRSRTLNQKYHCYLGRSRVATLVSPRDGRGGCVYCGRCLWGCPALALYTPSITLRECLRYPRFTYRPGTYVSHFTVNGSQRIGSVVASVGGGAGTEEIPVDRLVLAAGTLCSSKIVLESCYRSTGEILTLRGLMDNRQILIPFLNLRMIGKSYDPDSYQYHQLALGLEQEAKEEYIHAQITTLKTALVHPIIANVPLDLRTSAFVFRNVRCGLGVVNLNLCDRRRDDNYVTLRPDGATGRTQLFMSYTPVEDEKSTIEQAVRTVTKVLWELGCIVPPGMVHTRPMGASVHYAGTIPMSVAKSPLTASIDGQSHDYENLYLVDGSTLPFLPAKNITFTLIANAIRIADRAF